MRFYVISEMVVATAKHVHAIVTFHTNTLTLLLTYTRLLINNHLRIVYIFKRFFADFQHIFLNRSISNNVGTLILEFHRCSETTIIRCRIWWVRGSVKHEEFFTWFLLFSHYLVNRETDLKIHERYVIVSNYHLIKDLHVSLVE